MRLVAIAIWMFVFSFGLLAAPVRAQVTEIYRCTGATGSIFYTLEDRNTVGNDCKLVTREEVRKHAPNSSAGFPKSMKDSAIALHLQGGTLVVPVLINNAIALNFVVDSGAADVSIPADVVLTLMRTGTLKKSDFLGTRIYVLADGSKVPSQTFRIRSIKVGDRIVENVTGSVAPVQGTLLLGQSFLSRFKSWSIDNGKQVLLLK